MPRPHHLIALFALSLSVASAQSGTPYPTVAGADDSKLPADLRSRYWHQAAYLAWSWMHDVQSADTARIVLPVTLVQSLRNALIHIYNATGVEGRDSVIGANIRSDIPDRFFWTEEIKFDLRKAQWAKAWRKAKKLTGNKTVDRLITTYSLHPHIAYDNVDELVMRFSSEYATMMNRITDSLMALKGVDRDMAMMAGMDDGSVVASVDNGAWLLTFRAGFTNGYNSPEVANRTWRFRIYPDGRVEPAGTGWKSR
jgi:hypothetical protein